MATLTPQQRWVRDGIGLLTPTMTRLAKALDLHATSLRFYARGGRNPRPEVLDRLARHLRAHAHALQRHAARRPR